MTLDVLMNRNKSTVINKIITAVSTNCISMNDLFKQIETILIPKREFWEFFFSDASFNSRRNRLKFVECFQRFKPKIFAENKEISRIFSKTVHPVVRPKKIGNLNFFLDLSL